MSEETIESGTAAAEIIEAARGRKGAKLIDVAQFLDGNEAHGPVPMLAVPMPGGGIEINSVLDEVQAYRELRRERPDRREGLAKLDDLESFVGFTNRFKDRDSVIWISGSSKAPKFTVIIDYHEAVNPPEPETKALPCKAGDSPAEMVASETHVALPRFGKDRGVHVPELSDEWNLWIAANGRPLDQTNFSRLIENGAADIVDLDNARPEAAGKLATWFFERFGGKLELTEFYASSGELLQVAENLILHVEEKIGEVTSRTGGSKAVIFEGDQRSEVTIPTALLLELPVFRGGDLVQVPARLRVMPRAKNDGTKRLEYTVSLYGTDRVIAREIKDMAASIKAQTNLPVFVGSPE